MHSILSAFFAPDVLGLVLLAVAGVFVFFLIRPRKQDGLEESWLAFMQQIKGSLDARPTAVSKPDIPKAEVSNHGSSDRTAGLSSH